MLFVANLGRQDEGVPAPASAHCIDALFILREGEELREVSVMDGRLQQ